MKANPRYLFTSLTRISNLQEENFKLKLIPKDQWATGDYVAVEITHPGSGARIELFNGRMMDPLEGEMFIGALGIRLATLEVTGTWKEFLPGDEMHLLTGAGLLGKLTSTSTFTPRPIRVKYMGHVMVEGIKSTMSAAVSVTGDEHFDTPVVLLVGTSMSAGKTTTARIITHQLKMLNKRVLGAKLTGAGRYRDILTLKDAGADEVLDFVDAGLPSTVCSEKEYNDALDILLPKMARVKADIAVVEIGASPLEPYNGKTAIQRISDNIKCKILCASDPYAVYGVMKSFDFVPDLVSGPTTNTIAAVGLVEKLCGVRAVNLLRQENLHILKELLIEKLGIQDRQELLK